MLSACRFIHVNSMAVVWAWHGDCGLVRYDDDVSQSLETAYQQHGERAVSTVTIGGVAYTISHDNTRGWVQRRTLETYRSRPVVRCAPGPAAGSGAQVALGTAAATSPAAGFEVFVAGSPTADLASALGWTVLQAGDWAAGDLDPIMMSELGEAGEEVVRLPCDSAAIRCTFNRSTAEAAFATSCKCPSCGQPYPLLGPQPTGVIKWRVNAFYDCDGHPGCGTLEVRPAASKYRCGPAKVPSPNIALPASKHRYGTSSPAACRGSSIRVRGSRTRGRCGTSCCPTTPQASRRSPSSAGPFVRASALRWAALLPLGVPTWWSGASTRRRAGAEGLRSTAGPTHPTSIGSRASAPPPRWPSRWAERLFSVLAWADGRMGGGGIMDRGRFGRYCRERVAEASGRLVE